ncbi:PP2C family protein-serine/threonine phosphatase [Kitasatospora sp. NPDC057015]|uniref:PP2C family protein-serine/threonine phosphatase n=1 Tax=Kitasatospora sp. NPDC057015 TaxID=3346001 RepID=UPI003641BB92
MTDGIGRRLRRARVWRHRWTPVVAMTAVPTLLLVADELTGPGIRFGPLMVSAPPLSAAFCGPAGVLVVILVMFPCVILSARANGQLGSPNFPVQLSTILLISIAALVASAVRRRRERQLARSRSAVEVLQRTLLRPLPERVGPLTLACLYLTADEESSVGGDLYAATSARGRVRIVLGDAQGKGLTALETAGEVLGAFRRAARYHTSLAGLVAEVEESLRLDSQEAAAARGADSDAADRSVAADDFDDADFVTAVFLGVPVDDGSRIEVANLGHPPPLLLHAGAVGALEPSSATPPLGLGDLTGARPPIDVFEFPRGSTLLLYTDGVVEARNRDGDFYPLAERLGRWTSLPPAELLDAVHTDLRAHVGARLGDDVAMVAIRHAEPARDLRHPAPGPAAEEPAVDGSGA